MLSTNSGGRVSGRLQEQNNRLSYNYLVAFTGVYFQIGR